MSAPLVVTSAAEAEIGVAIDWYDEQQQRPDLAAASLAELRSVVDRICQQPELLAVVYHYGRRAGLKRFPYAVYYDYAGGVVTVVAVLHNRQSRDSILSERL